MSLKWTRKAAADLDAIYDHYVVLIGPEKALKAVQDIVEQVKPLQEVANQGQGDPARYQAYAPCPWSAGRSAPRFG